MLHVALFMIAAAVGAEAFAGTCSFAPGNSVRNDTVSLPSTVFTGRDIPIGQVIYSTNLGYGGVPEGNCTGLSDTDQFEQVSFEASGGQLTSWNQGSYGGKVYKTGQDGIGIAFLAGTPMSYSGVPSGNVELLMGPAQGTKAYFNDTVAIVLIKIGDVKPGKINASILPQIRLYYGSNRLNAVNYSVTGSTTITTGTCKTPDVAVDMGTFLKERAFTGVGSATQWKPVNIALQNCPAFTSNVTLRYTLTPGTPIVNSSQGIIALKPEAGKPTATGIGLQIAKANRTAVTYNQLMPVDFKPQFVEDGNYTIPLLARYYQTASAVTPGTANALVTFTLNYQ
ncbi:fimbrial protein [Burkholderia latens]|uniref:fimbrial protein n=1 Tax=Burkholderia latens TaxID=488446 RepID=UPI0014794553|nr:fimbrial protein [Burkholderia latens]